MIPVWLSIDVCKAWLDIHISPEPKGSHPEAIILRLPNTESGVEELIKQLRPLLRFEVTFFWENHFRLIFKFVS